MENRPPWMDTEEQVGRMQRVIMSVGPTLRGLPHDAAAARLEAAFRAAGVDIPTSATFVRRIARMHADPWWPIRHPIRARRTSRQEWAQSRELELADRDEDDDPEFDALTERLRHSRVDDHIRSVHWTPVPGGVLCVVTIDPWSDKVAKRIRKLALPVEVTVHPHIR